MQDIGTRVAAAQGDRRAAERILEEYLPFIKKQAGSLQNTALAYEDMLSIAMIAFLRAIEGYQPEKGPFLGYAQICIRSRLLDEIRRTQPLHIPLEEEDAPSAVDNASLAHYDKECERQEIADEIADANAALGAYGIQFSLLAKIGPKQSRSRALCLQVARHIIADAQLYASFLQSGKLPQAAPAQALGISPKTIEKHRKYIVALVVLLSGDYPRIHSFLREEAKA